MQPSKSTIQDFVLLGGEPAFAQSLHVNQPNVENLRGFSERLNTALQRRWFTNDGPLVRELEEKLAGYLHVRHCVATCNGTLALQLVVRALELKGEVIVPSFTFISLAHSLLWLGIEPVFCDIDRKTWNIDPKECEALITSHTSAVVGVHLWGRPCDTEALRKLTDRWDLRLVFDAAHAFGCEHEGSMIGGFGDAEVFSFHATKVFHTFEGGAIATNNDDLAARLRSIRNFGFTGYDEVSEIGTNAKLPEASAAMGLANFEVFDSTLEGNRRRYDAYRENLAGIPGLRLLRYGDHGRHNHHYVVLEVHEERSGLSRDDLMRVLHSEHVLARRYFYPGCHRMEPHRTRRPEVDRRLPNTNDMAQRVLVLPGGSALTITHVHEICNIFRLAIEGSDALRAQLALNADANSDSKQHISDKTFAE